MVNPTTLPRALLSPARLAAAGLRTLRIWAFRRGSRKSLARLGVHQLRDIGLDPLTASAECAKPFWRD